jgi:hypothetical protein
MNILEARSKLAAVLAPVLEGDPTVLTDLVDSITPPALMISWGEPWMTFQTPCFNNAQLVVTAVGSRLVPGAGQAQVEALVDYTITRIRLDSPNWSLTTVSGMRVFPIAQTNYLASRITLQVTID